MQKNLRTLTKMIETARDSFSTSLSHFLPMYDQEKNDIKERNISFYLANAFLSTNKKPKSFAFMEIPFKSSDAAKNCNQAIDVFAFNRNIGIFIECKRIWDIRGYKSIIRDSSRLTTNNVHKILNEYPYFQKSICKPKTIYALIVGQTWNNNIKDWWCNRQRRKAKWNNLAFLRKYRRTFIEIDSGLYWLYAYRRLANKK